MRRLVVFGHPNHELAIFGLLQQARPHMIFISDGAHPRRIEESRIGLDAIGLLDRSTYLEIPESDLYAGILDHDLDLFESIAARVAADIDEVDPQQVWCDGVEFYNPAHDIVLPIVSAALRGCSPEILEIPLVWERREPAGTFAVQRVMPSRESEACVYRLTPDQVQRKKWARDEVYGALRTEMGPVLGDIPDAELALEQLRPADAGMRTVSDDCVLRYEYRGELLQSLGEVERAITWSDHYAPVAGALFSR